MDRDSIHGKTRAVLDTAAARLGVPVHDARLLRLHGNASYALPSAGLVIRIALNPQVLGPVTAAIAVTRWLADRGFPCTVPAGIDDQPLVIAGHVVSAWRYLPTTETHAPTSAEMGTILRGLHAQGDPPYPLPSLDDPLTSVTAAISDSPGAMPPASQSWLQEQIMSLRRQWSALDFPRPAGLIHGDAHLGNLMRAASGQAVLGDWDHVATGPREWDLAQIHYMDRRFGRAGQNGTSPIHIGPGAGIMDDMLTTEYDGRGRCLVATRRLSRMADDTSSPVRQANQDLKTAADVGGQIIAWADDWEVSVATDPWPVRGWGRGCGGRWGRMTGWSARRWTGSAGTCGTSLPLIASDCLAHCPRCIR